MNETSKIKDTVDVGKNRKTETEKVADMVKTLKTDVAKLNEIIKPPKSEPTEQKDTPAKIPNSKLKVLFCISEALPFSATGGLGEVGGSLPKAITEASSSVDIRVIIPLYGSVPSEVRKKMAFLGSTYVNIGGRGQYCGVFELSANGLTYYFIDNEMYFKRDNIYGYNDDGERFAFFSRAILDTINITGFKPSLIHANDWQTALVIIYLKTIYGGLKDFSKIKTLFTIHNLNYQGRFNHSYLNDIFGIDYKYKDLLDYSNELNLVKAAIESCDMFNAVSNTYAQEIQTPEFSCGLQSCISRNAYKLVGILNGIDYKTYNPQKDKELFANYGVRSLANKAVNKRGVQKLFQMQVDSGIPLIIYNGRLTDQKGIGLIKDSIDNILSQRIQMVVMGNGEKRYENFFDYVESKYQGKFKAIRYSAGISKKLYAAADLLLMPSLFEPCGLSHMIASRYGTVPIVRETGGLKDSVRDFGCEGGGNGYTFANYNANDMVYSIRRGVEDFINDGQNWDKKMIACINKDFSWKPTVQEYLKLYKKIGKVKNA